MRITLNRSATRAIIDTATQQEHFSKYDILAAIADWLARAASHGRAVSDDPVRYHAVSEIEHPALTDNDIDAVSEAIMKRLGYWSKDRCPDHPDRFDIDCIACNNGVPRWRSHPIGAKPESVR